YLVEACVLLNLMKKKGITHVHAHFGTNPATVALLANRLCGISYSFTVHGPEEFDKPEALSLEEKIRHASFVVAISSFGKSQLFRWCSHENWTKIKIVRCGLDAQFLHSRKTDVPENRRLVCVGRLCEQKGQLLLLEAVHMLKNEGQKIDLVLAGDGPLRPEIESLVDRLGLADHVRITGWISSGQVLEEIQASRALVLPSFAEGLPVVLMEACALRRPVVTTSIAGIPELVQDGESGWVVPAGSVEKLGDALKELFETSPKALSEMGEKAYGRVSSQHDIRIECANLKHFFISALEPA
ncbi:MAG TPA: glycosyltransferase, partial [Burkholderiales bacterium]|nr:glycosyltransferase [Burkholderiales bacterium]